MPVTYPEKPVTIGEHIRKKRMDMRLLQSDVAKIVRVTEDSITLWENNHAIPQITHFPRIINFLGYCPHEFDESTLSGRLMAYRYRNGLSNKKMGKLLGVDGSTILAWEKEVNTPRREQLQKIELLLMQGRC